MNKEALENRKAVSDIKMALDIGEISYNEAKQKIMPVLERINGQGEKIAKKYGKKYHPVTFSEIIR